jgi:hypothetical protein
MDGDHELSKLQTDRYNSGHQRESTGDQFVDYIEVCSLKCIDPNPRAYFQNNSLDCRIFKHTVATAPTRATPTLGKCLAPMCTFLLLLHT